MRHMLLLGAITLLATSARGDITFVLDNGNQQGRPGHVLMFTGTVHNQGEAPLSGFGSSYYPGIPPALQFSPVWDFGFWQAGAGESFTGDFFTIQIQPWVEPGFVSDQTI